MNRSWRDAGGRTLGRGGATQPRAARRCRSDVRGADAAASHPGRAGEAGRPEPDVDQPNRARTRRGALARRLAARSAWRSACRWSSASSATHGRSRRTQGISGCRSWSCGSAGGTGIAREVELRTKPDEPWRSIDVALADDRRRRLIVIECWNVIGDIGASARSSTRKAAEAEALGGAPLGRCAARDAPRLGGQGHGAEPPAGRPLPGGLRRPLPGQQRRLGQGAQRRHRTAEPAGPRVGERRRHADLPAARPIPRRTRR